MAEGNPIDMAEHGRMGNISTGTAYKNVRQLATSQLLLDYDSTTNPVYLGSAVPGTATATAEWQIRKLAYDSSGNITSIKYAAGTPEFTQVWNDRTGLSYS